MKTVLTDLGFVCALGVSLDEISTNARQGQVLIGKMNMDGCEMPYGLTLYGQHHTMRCYDLLDMVLAQLTESLDSLKNTYPLERVGIVLGSSNTGVHEAERHILTGLTYGKCPSEFSLDELDLGSPSAYVAEKTGFKGICYTISTACSSSAKAFASARQLILSGLCDAVLVGGVDSCCSFALRGFNALEALSSDICLPFSKNRLGINLGEGAALFIMQARERGIAVTGVGETSDAYHLTHPDPTGKGAEEAMRLALQEAGLQPDEIDYINLHGTGTMANDAMESLAVHTVFGTETLCASTKPLTGHALGAAGAIEVALSWLMLRDGFVIPHIYDNQYDPTCAPLRLAEKGEKRHCRRILSNSFAFGGSNASVVLESCE